ncbi:nuclear transport factor 2 family protein [Deinococcus yavapaiensis]|uniref:Calcium/calmodulin dependent protein kinase II association protein n=1 Tax=Deinococcus yavapaiensis KR-236 TaxID=694435 RepID=A0A318SSR0_9DEIO|nr:nuclear transport factor 2 family protein [Deinococcus yavapaiensis]PYE56246.1 calcium/calmodulin dependent protein kinase II association protein [Deinococcus yavapaiensis KR-236]
MNAPIVVTDAEVLAFLRRHLEAIFASDWETYEATTAPDLSLYEHFVTPHRQLGLDFHRFMIENSWATTNGRAHHVSILEPHVQVLASGSVVVVTYTLVLSVAGEAGIVHKSTNETRVLERREGEWRVVHVHKSPAN